MRAAALVALVLVPGCVLFGNDVPCAASADCPAGAHSYCAPASGTCGAPPAPLFADDFDDAAAFTGRWSCDAGPGTLVEGGAAHMDLPGNSTPGRHPFHGCTAAAAAVRDVDAAMTITPTAHETAVAGLLVRVRAEDPDQFAFNESVDVDIGNSNGVLHVGRSAGPVLGDFLRDPPATPFVGDAPVRLRLRVVGVGPTHVLAKAWLASGEEPAPWAFDFEDGTRALEQAGAVAFAAFRFTDGNVGVAWDAVRVFAAADVRDDEALP